MPPAEIRHTEKTDMEDVLFRLRAILHFVDDQTPSLVAGLLQPLAWKHFNKRTQQMYPTYDQNPIATEHMLRERLAADVAFIDGKRPHRLSSQVGWLALTVVLLFLALGLLG